MSHVAQQMPSFKRALPLLLIAGLLALAFIIGGKGLFTLQTLAENRAALEAYTAQNIVLAVLVYIVVYAAVVALSIPGALALTLMGGFLFGALLGGTATVLAATAGAVILFLLARSVLKDTLSKKAGPFLAKLKAGFESDAFNYLLFLRLVPAFPFWLVNIAPAFSNVSLKNFAAATLLGIIPGTFAFSFVGQGLGSVLDAQTAAHDACVATKGAANCPFEFEASALVTTNLLLALAALGVVALIPVLLRKFRKNV
jgi:uncharacterized membrane protein YdjX (TVP38/TMEM64 family)